MPTPEEYAEYVSMDLKLGAVHQQFITQELRHVRRLLVQHDQEIALLAILILALGCLAGYTQYELRRLENGHLKESSRRIRETSTTEDKSGYESS